MRKLVLLMHTSLDGFVAGPKGEMDWIHVDEEMFDFAGAQTDLADTALYGRVTYELMDNYWPTAGDKPDASKHDKQHSRWYNTVTKVVVSKTMKSRNIPNTQIISENVPEEIRKLKEKQGKNILIFGSPTVCHLLTKNNLIDEYWLLVNPILIGSGIPMFNDIKDKIKLKLSETKVFASGVVGLRYEK